MSFINTLQNQRDLTASQKQAKALEYSTRLRRDAEATLNDPRAPKYMKRIANRRLAEARRVEGTSWYESPELYKQARTNLELNPDYGKDNEPKYIKAKTPIGTYKPKLQGEEKSVIIVDPQARAEGKVIQGGGLGTYRAPLTDNNIKAIEQGRKRTLSERQQYYTPQKVEAPKPELVKGDGKQTRQQYLDTLEKFNQQKETQLNSTLAKNIRAGLSENTAITQTMIYENKEISPALYSLSRQQPKPKDPILTGTISARPVVSPRPWSEAEVSSMLLRETQEKELNPLNRVRNYIDFTGQTGLRLERQGNTIAGAGLVFLGTAGRTAYDTSPVGITNTLITQGPVKTITSYNPLNVVKAIKNDQLLSSTSKAGRLAELGGLAVGVGVGSYSTNLAYRKLIKEPLFNAWTRKQTGDSRGILSNFVKGPKTTKLELGGVEITSVKVWKADRYGNLYPSKDIIVNGQATIKGIDPLGAKKRITESGKVIDDLDKIRGNLKDQTLEGASLNKDLSKSTQSTFIRPTETGKNINLLTGETVKGGAKLEIPKFKTPGLKDTKLSTAPNKIVSIEYGQPKINIKTYDIKFSGNPLKDARLDFSGRLGALVDKAPILSSSTGLEAISLIKQAKLSPKATLEASPPTVTGPAPILKVIIPPRVDTERDSEIKRNFKTYFDTTKDRDKDSLISPILDTTIKSRLSFDSTLKLKTGSITKPDTNTNIETSLNQDLSDRASIIVSPPIQYQEPVSRLDLAPSPGLTRPKEKSKIKPVLKLRDKDDEEKGRLVQGYNVLVKEKGRFIKVNKKPLPEYKAKNLGADVVDNTPTAQFKLKRAKKIKAQDSTRFFKSTKFRAKKGSYIELSRNRIDSTGELQGITVKGWLARKKTLGGL